MKKLLKKLLKNTKLFKAYSQRRLQRQFSEVISKDTVEERFTSIYSKGLWYANKESRSGSGSTMSATQGVRDALPEVVRKYQAETLLDLGCGDFYWMKSVELGCQYIGGDIVKDLIEENQKLYGSDTVRFMHLDAIRDQYPACDIILCRQVLFHLSFEDGKKVIENCKQSGAKYLITTSNPTIEKNRDISTGDFRDINLEAAPYSLPRPVDGISDDSRIPERIMGIWALRQA